MLVDPGKYKLTILIILLVDAFALIADPFVVSLLRAVAVVLDPERYHFIARPARVTHFSDDLVLRSYRTIRIEFSNSGGSALVKIVKLELFCTSHAGFHDPLHLAVLVELTLDLSFHSCTGARFSQQRDHKEECDE